MYHRDGTRNFREEVKFQKRFKYENTQTLLLRN